MGLIRNLHSIRLPVAWEYIISNQYDAGSQSFNQDFFNQYNELVITAIHAGAYVIIDLHNYGRWSDQSIIGQGGANNGDVRGSDNLVIWS